MTTYDWRRFWIRRDGTLNLDDSGYLLDPEDPDPVIRRLNPNVVTSDKLREAPCVIFLGEPGIGKTTALANEVSAANTERVLNFDLREFASDASLVQRVFGSQDIREWVSSDQMLTLFLDSLDECLIHVRTLGPLLAAGLKRLPTTRMRLRVACRTVEWPETLDSALRAIWQDATEVELAPLRKRDVALAAHAEGLDESAFLAQVAEHGVVPFACRPITLKFLLEAFRRHRSFPASVWDLYDEGCQHLCREASSTRRDARVFGRLSSSQRLDLAGQIMATAMLARRLAIFAGSDQSDAGPDDLRLEELMWGKIGGVDRIVSEQDLREVLDTGLFSGRSGRRHGPSHSTFAEFLTAKFLLQKGVADAQIRDLVWRTGLDGRERVIPQLREVAAWMSIKQPTLLAALIDNDPQVLLRSQLRNLDATMKSGTVRSLLALASDGRIIDRESRRQYASLRYPGLASDLRPFLTAENIGFVGRRMAIEIAIACECQELADELASIALNSREEYAVRSMAAAAVARVGLRVHKERLRPLLEMTEKDDPDDELFGYALRALWPDSLAARDLFERFVRDPRNPNLMGGYSSFLWSLPRELAAEHVLAALGWVCRRPSDHHDSGPLADLAPEIMKAAWPHVGNREILSAFARAAAHRLHQHDEVLGERDPSGRHDAVIKSDERGRRRFIEALARAVQTYNSEDRRVLAMHAARLLEAEDFVWLVQSQASASRGSDCDWWLELVRWSFRDERLEHVEALLDAARGRSDVHNAFRHLLEPMALGSPEDQRRRAELDRRKRLDRMMTEPRRAEAPLADRVESMLVKIESGAPDVYWSLDLALVRAGKSGGSDGEFEPNLWKLSSWQALDASTQARIAAAAAQYLAQSDPRDDEWLGRGNHDLRALAGYRAVRLVATALPSRLEDLGSDVWAKWAATILTFPERQDPEDEALTRECIGYAYHRAPDAILRCVGFLIQDENWAHSLDRLMWKLRMLWDRQLARTILRGMANPALAGPSVVAILKYALTHAERTTWLLGRWMIRSRHVSPQHHDRAVHVAVAFLEGIPAHAWPELSGSMREDVPFWRDVMHLFAGGWYPAAAPKMLAELNETALADLYLWLRTFMPEETTGMTGGGSLDALTVLCDNLLRSLKSRGTSEAVLEIRRIASCLPEDRWLKFTILDGEELRIRESWKGVGIRDLQRIVDDAAVRIIEEDGQLLGVVLDSLQRLQTRLQHETPRVYYLWDEKPKMPKEERRLSDYIKQHLDDDLKRRGIIANREVELRDTDVPDIRVDAVRLREGQAIDRLSVVVEVKGCWNPGLKDDMRTQLRDRYMKQNAVLAGLYVVGWYLCAQWSDDDRRKLSVPGWTIDEARSFFGKQATELSEPSLELRAYVLDLRLPSSPAPRARSRRGGARGQGRPRKPRSGQT